ncbi:MAG: ATP-binding protein [Chloroflexota bacterium]
MNNKESIDSPHLLGNLPVMTIRTRLTLWYSSLLATVIVVFGISLFSILNWTWRSLVKENMIYVAQQTAENINIDLSTGRIEVQTPEVLDYLISTYPFGIQVRQADGTLVRASSNLRTFTDPFDPDTLTSKEWVTHDLYLGKTHVYVLTAPIPSSKGTIVGTVQVLSTLTTVDAALERLFKIMLGVGTVALLLAFMVGSVIAGQALQPIDTISQAAKQITAAGDLSKRIPYYGPPDELGQLTETFNATLGRLERLFLTQRRFVADVSHELRTPLTTIQGNLDLLKRYGDDPTSMEAIDSEVKRMTRLVGDLLLLAQADGGRLPLDMTTVELDTLALEVFKQARVLAQDIDLRLGMIEPVHVRGDEDRLRQLLLNLVTNAIKYTPAGGKVTINLIHKAGYAFLSVSDTGIGIPPEDLDHIFDRFYRVDKARSRQMGGTGLGLSIASWIAEAHQGRIWAESNVGQGSTFTLQLPSTDQPETPEAMRETRPRLVIPIRLRRAWAAQEEARAAKQNIIGDKSGNTDSGEASTPRYGSYRSMGSEHPGGDPK